MRLLSALLLLAVDATLAFAQPATVILVRHAERATAPQGDPILTDAGTQRALDLATALADAGVTSIITTHLQRTRLTAKPLADARGVTPTIVAAGGGDHAQSVAKAVREQPSGSTVLVVGHSNTVPAIIAALGGPRMPDLCDQQYSMLFVLEMKPDKAPSLIRGRYGVADPADADACTRTMR